MPAVDMERRRAYLREYQRAWMARRRAEWFAGKSCVRCGSTERLEVDHRDPATKVHHAVWSWAAPRRLAELAKCQPLCHVCHVEKSRQEATKHPDHGTRSRYTKGCRCDECRAANTAYRIALRNRQRN